MNISEKFRWGKKIFFHENVLPEQVTIFVTSRCNLKCKHCFYWQNLNNTAKEFSLAEVEKFAPTIGKFSFLSLTGGEPFLRDDLAEIVKVFISKNNVSRVSIPTNGFLTEKIAGTAERILKISNGKKILIKVSLDGIGEQHDEIRGVKGSFEKAVGTIKELKKLKQKYPNFKVGVLLTLSRLNEYKLRDTYGWIKNNLSVDVVGLNFARGDLKDISIKQVDLNNYKNLYSFILEDLLRKNGDSSFFYEFYSAYKFKISELIAKTVRQKKYPLECYAGRLSAVIDSSLDVFPCENLNKRMGNLRDYGYNFHNLWFSEDSFNIRKYIVNVINDGCWCTSECNLQINSFFNIKQLFPLITRTAGYGLKRMVFV